MRVITATLLLVLGGCSSMNHRAVDEYEGCRGRVLTEQLTELPFDDGERWVIRTIDIEQQAVCR